MHYFALFCIALLHSLIGSARCRLKSASQNPNIANMYVTSRFLIPTDRAPIKASIGRRAFIQALTTLRIAHTHTHPKSSIFGANAANKATKSSKNNMAPILKIEFIDGFCSISHFALFTGRHNRRPTGLKSTLVLISTTTTTFTQIIIILII